MNIELIEDCIHSLRKWFRAQSKLKLIFTFALICTVSYIVYSRKYYGKEYHQAVIAEIELAKRICENSEEMIANDMDLLKMDHGDLRGVKVNNSPAELKYVKYPKVMFFKTGVENIAAKDRSDIFCVFSDPRSASATYYYDYQTRSWENKMKFRFRHGFL
ncbi:MAG: hypothetical protein IT559_08885 [Alphaproteobacteria bacterium]|nr:hypothetical protein [Alphaproteobacteria bacterium]